MRRRPGPPPKPTALRILQGNPGKGRLNRQEARLPAAGPEPPYPLTPGARAIWDRHVTALVAAGLLTAVDTTVYATYCRLQAMGDYYGTETERLIDDAAQSSPRARGRKRRPAAALGVAMKLWNLAGTFAGRLGLTPSDRTRISATPVGSGVKDKWAGLL